jgi:hypothetical protein
VTILSTIQALAQAGDWQALYAVVDAYLAENPPRQCCPTQPEMQAFFSGQPVSDEFFTELSTRLISLMTRMEASAADFDSPPAAGSLPTAKNDLEIL